MSLVVTYAQDSAMDFVWKTWISPAEFVGDDAGRARALFGLGQSELHPVIGMHDTARR